MSKEESRFWMAITICVTIILGGLLYWGYLIENRNRNKELEMFKFCNGEIVRSDWNNRITDCKPAQ